MNLGLYLLIGFILGASLLIFGKEKFLPLTTKGIDGLMHVTPRDKDDREFVALFIIGFSILYPLLILIAVYMAIRKRTGNDAQNTN